MRLYKTIEDDLGVLYAKPKNHRLDPTEGDKLLKLIEDMQCDRDNFSASGKQTFDQIGELLGWGHQK